MKLHALNIIKLIGTTILVIVGVSTLVDHPAHVRAAADDVTGWLWSDMPNGSDHANPLGASNPSGGRGLGWVSLSGATGGNVGFSSTTGSFSGYGWSEFGGWLDFSPTGSFPSAPGTLAASARISTTCLNDIARTSCPVLGWLRFNAGIGAPETVGGWDGWVSMHKTDDFGQTVGYGVSYNKVTGQLSGYAWGDWVAGWIDFSRMNIQVAPPQLLDQCLDSNGNTITFPLGSPLPQDCTQLICYTPQGSQITYPVGTPEPSQCNDNPNDDICEDEDAYNFGRPEVCSFDFCPLDVVPYDQAQNSGPWLGVDGLLYGTAGGQCIPDQCIDPGHPGFDAGPDEDAGEVRLPNGMCVLPSDIDCATYPDLCPTSSGGIRPIYRED